MTNGHHKFNSMKTIKNALIIAMIITTSMVIAQNKNESVTKSKEKKVHKFTIERTISASASDVWSVVGEDFGAVSKSHPKIVSSTYINGSLKAEKGAERVCNFNEKKTKFTHEKIVEYDPSNFMLKVKVFNAEGIPMNTDYSYAIYSVVPINNESSKLVFTMQYRTKPAFLGGIAKGGFKKTIRNYTLAVEHYVLTGEAVTKDNFKRIKKAYGSK